MPLHAVGEEDGTDKKDTLSSLSSILGEDLEADAAKQREEELEKAIHECYMKGGGENGRKLFHRPFYVSIFFTFIT